MEATPRQPDSMERCDAGVVLIPSSTGLEAEETSTQDYGILQRTMTLFARAFAAFLDDEPR